MIAPLLTLLLMASVASDTVAAPARLDNGRWVERRDNGAPDCENDQARAIELFYLDEPPHPRSSNIGDVRFSLGSVSARYVLTGVDIHMVEDDSANRAVHLAGGIVHTVGVERQGVISSFLRGRMTASLRQDASGDLFLDHLNFSQRGHDDIRLVDTGMPAVSGDAEPLRGFAYCGAL